MRIDSVVKCRDFPCLDTRRESYSIPAIDVDPVKVSILLISEAAPEDPGDHYYAGEDALFVQTTLLAFQDAGVEVNSMQELIDRGIYLTTAVKCGKTGYVGSEICGCLLKFRAYNRLVDEGFHKNLLDITSSPDFKFPEFLSGEEFVNYFLSNPVIVEEKGLSLYIFSKERGRGKTTLAHYIMWKFSSL